MTATIPPYNFVPVNFDASARKEPVWHDAFPKEGRLSGRIRCTAYALTPMIVGNEQKAFGALDGAEQAELKKLAQQGEGSNKEPDPDHKLLRPFRFPRGGYGIPASALKGMTANTYAAITNSPIERVNDRTFSFRPNMGFGDQGPQPKAGILLKDGNGWQVLAFEVGQNEFTKGNRVAPEVERWLEKADAATLEDWLAACPESREILLPCGGGIDGEALLQGSFEGKARGSSQFVKLQITVDKLQRQSTLLPVSKEIERLYQQTLKHLREDHLEGHPKEDNPQAVKKALDQHRKLVPGKIVFLEVLNGEIVSMGMHFRYRWRYLDSVTARYKDLEAHETRPPFDLDEEKGQSENTLTLSPRRRLFGFVDADVSSDEGVVNAMAGRVRFSFAEHKTGTGVEKSFVPLKILGGPKPSSYEFYLTQDGGDNLLNDYGDTARSQYRGEPRGRKFYLHQPEAASDMRDTYRIQPKEVDNTTSLCNKLNQTAETLLAPHIKGEGADRFPAFGFTVLFENLDPEELNTLVLALGLGNAPDAVDAAIAEKADVKKIQLYNQHETKTALRAHKIGHGQPLGLGSLMVRLDKLEVLEVDNGQPKWKEAPEYLAPREANELPSALAAVTAFQKTPENTRVGYPLAQSKSGPAIHAFHSKARAEQANARRGKPSNPRQYALPAAESVRGKPFPPVQEQGGKGKPKGPGKPPSKGGGRRR